MIAKSLAGVSVGLPVGVSVGLFVALSVGFADGAPEGLPDGWDVFSEPFVTVTLHTAFAPRPSADVTVIVALPAFFAVTIPFLFTVATVLFDVNQLNFLTVGFFGEVMVAFTFLFFLGRMVIFVFPTFFALIFPLLETVAIFFLLLL